MPFKSYSNTIDLSQARDSKTPKGPSQIYPLLLLTRYIKFKIGKHIEWVEPNLNFIILPGHSCI